MAWGGTWGDDGSGGWASGWVVVMGASMLSPGAVKRAYVDGNDFAEEPAFAVYLDRGEVPIRGRHLEECGIAEVEVRFVRWAVKPKGWL